MSDRRAVMYRCPDCGTKIAADETWCWHCDEISVTPSDELTVPVAVAATMVARHLPKAASIALVLTGLCYYAITH